MEVASPLTMGPGSATQNKRSLSRSPPLVGADRMAKRRRFHGDPSIESLSADFSANTLWLKSLPSNNQSFFSNAGNVTLKRSRNTESPTRLATEDMNRVLKEQEATIGSLRKDKLGLESSLGALKTDHERLSKENQILRRAVTIQQERQTKAETEIKQVKEIASERIRGLEQTVLTLQYHIQTQHPNVGNDFMSPPPPDIF